MVQFLPLGLQIPEDYPDRNRYFSLEFRQRRANSTEVAAITLMAPGDVLFLYTDGVHNGRDDKERQLLEAIIHEHSHQLPARDICDALLVYALERDDHLREVGDQALIDDKTAFIIKRT